MATSKEFIDFVCEQIRGVGEITSKKMFGEYMVYVNAKPVLLVCDDTVFVKMRDEIKDMMRDAETGYPYNGAKLHYILDIDNDEFARKLVQVLEPITPVPKPRKRTKSS